MAAINEPGVLSGSRRHFHTPSALARQILYYPTRSGHYFVDEQYDFSDASTVAQAASHKNFLLLMVEEGELEVTDGRRVQRAGAGEVALLDCRGTHRFRALRAGRTLFVHFDGSDSAEFFRLIRAAHGGRIVMPVPPGSTMQNDLLQIFNGMTGADRAPETQLSQWIYRALCDLLVPPPPRDWGTAGTPVGDTVLYILNHLQDELTVPALAERVALSPAHFSRLFKQSTGYSPHEFLVLRRIDEAKNLLQTTGLSVKEIAFRTGYRSEVNFIASFLSKVGVSPAAFRKTRH
ncbi:MAG: helix-turn-helix domain-containing protein [Butyricicoccus sp.]